MLRESRFFNWSVFHGHDGCDQLDLQPPLHIWVDHDLILTVGGIGTLFAESVDVSIVVPEDGLNGFRVSGLC